MALRTSVVLFFLLIILTSSTALAHVPRFVEEGSSVATASIVENPAKSQVIYTELPDGNIVHYYRFHVDEGERIKLSLHVPNINGFEPDLILMGPGLGAEGPVPSYVEVPDGSGFMVFEGKVPQFPFYEPFTPSKAYELVDVDMSAPSEGEYYAAIYSARGEGKYSLAIGYVETFSIIEWVSVPVDVIGIHLWEGQSILVVLGPLIATIIAGLYLVFRGGLTLSAFSITGVSAGLLYIGGGLMTLLQMFIAIMGSSPGSALILTLFFVFFPILLGILILKTVYRDSIGTGERVSLVVLGVIGLFSWAGLVIGPMIAILSGLLPAK